MRDKLIKASLKMFEAQVEKHKTNVEYLLHNPVGVAEHSDLMETIEKEMEQISHYEDLISVINKHF